MKDLTIHNVKKLIGAKIEWSSPIYQANTGYFGKGKDGGIGIIKSVDFNKRNPIEFQAIKGSNLSRSFLDKTNQGNLLSDTFCFSDSDRYVSFKKQTS